jgi:hypothetical protein
MLIYHDDFSDKQDLEKQFNCTIDPKFQILYAIYTQGGYDGSAWVLFQDRVTGNLFEVNGSHCSCYGLEDQWEPEAVNVRSLRNRMRDGNVGPYEVNINEDLEAVLKNL